jgi:hypothetical protein
MSTYAEMMLTLYLGAMIWAVVESKKKWRTVGAMFVTFLGAMLFILAFGMFTGNGKSAVDFFFVPSFLIVAIAGVIHARRNRYSTN